MYEHKQGSLYASLSNLGRVYSCVELFCTIFGFGNQTVYYTIERLVLKKCSIGIKGTGCLIRGRKGHQKCNICTSRFSLFQLIVKSQLIQFSVSCFFSTFFWISGLISTCLSFQIKVSQRWFIKRPLCNKLEALIFAIQGVLGGLLF